MMITSAKVLFYHNTFVSLWIFGFVMTNDIENRLKEIKQALPEGVELLAVSKTHPVELLMQAYGAGQRIFAENKVQEMASKHLQMPDDVIWHFIGHVQRNKIRMMAPFVSVIHGVDSYDVLAETDRQAKRFGRRIVCLLQIHIAREETKFGFSPEECTAMLEHCAWKELKNVTIGGVMGMASRTDDNSIVESEFRLLKDFFDRTREKFFSDSADFRTISAGMSGDWPVAVKCGSNMVRIGTDIFGCRNYDLQ